MKKLLVLGVVLATSALAACSSASSTGQTGISKQQEASVERQIRANAYYWQRTDDVSAQYLTGPKAQHQLNMDIASCEAEVPGLIRLGSIRTAEKPAGIEPTNSGGETVWGPATRNGPLFTEYTDFQDFEGCMKHQGWERSEFVRPEVAARAAHTYNATILGLVANPFAGDTTRYGYTGNVQRGGFNN